MKKIWTFIPTKHFLARMRERHLTEMLVSYCLARGNPCELSDKKRAYSLCKKDIITLLSSGYISKEDVSHVFYIQIITHKNKLITCYTQIGDIGI
jgi:hypothetical protein